MPRYTFRVPVGWDEVPISIADLGGSEIDLRFVGTDPEKDNEPVGDLCVIVAPVGRFRDTDGSMSLKIEDIGDPRRVIEGFSPEISRDPIGEDNVLAMDQFTGEDGLTYYSYHVKTTQRPHMFITITAEINRVFIMAVFANNRQYRKHKDMLEKIAMTFRVDSERLPDLKMDKVGEFSAYM